VLLFQRQQHRLHGAKRLAVQSAIRDLGKLKPGGML
jgi:hypothetical protein